MRTNWIARRGSFSSRPSPRSFDMPGGALSSVVRGLFSSVLVPLPVVPWFLVWSSPRHVLLASCLSCGRFPSFLRRACLLSVPLVPLYRRIAWLPRSFDKGGGAMTGCVSIWVRLGRCCLLLVGGESGDVAGRFPLVGVARCRRVDGVGGWRDFRRSCCLPWAFLSVWCVSLAPVACFALVVVVGRRLIVIGCCRRGSASSSLVSVVVVSPHPACPRVSSSSVLARGASAVDHLVDRLVVIVSPLVFSPCLACRAAGRRAVRVLSRPAV